MKYPMLLASSFFFSLVTHAVEPSKCEDLFAKAKDHPYSFSSPDGKQHISIVKNSHHYAQMRKTGEPSFQMDQIDEHGNPGTRYIITFPDPSDKCTFIRTTVGYQGHILPEINSVDRLKITDVKDLQGGSPQAVPALRFSFGICQGTNCSKTFNTEIYESNPEPRVINLYEQETSFDDKKSNNAVSAEDTAVSGKS